MAVAPADLVDRVALGKADLVDLADRADPVARADLVGRVVPAWADLGLIPSRWKS